MKSKDVPPHSHPHSRALEPEDIIRQKVKAELRKRMRALRHTAPLASCQARSVKIVETLLGLPPVAAARRVALFYPMEERHEVDLRALDATLRDRGVELFYPQVDMEVGRMAFRRVGALRELVRGTFGLHEPKDEAEEAFALDVIIVPALAVDELGQRIGYGAGFYDRTLPRFAPPAIAIAVAYDYQVIAEVPVTEGDVACTWVVTDARSFEVKESG